jgi:hypothetical protein
MTAEYLGYFAQTCAERIGAITTLHTADIAPKDIPVTEGVAKSPLLSARCVRETSRRARDEGATARTRDAPHILEHVGGAHRASFGWA